MVRVVLRVATRYENLDKLISAANADGRVNVFYSTPAQYVAAKQKETDVVWPLFDGNNADFFPCVADRISRSKAMLKLIGGPSIDGLRNEPVGCACDSVTHSYADGEHQFWTGYFTSRPALKRCAALPVCP